MKVDIKFAKNRAMSINHKPSSINSSNTLLNPTESFLSKIKSKTKIVKSNSLKFTNLFGKVNQNSNEEFNFLDYQNYVSDNLINYLSDIENFKKELKQINKKYIIYSKLRYFRRKLSRPSYIPKMNKNNFSLKHEKKITNLSIINLIQNKNKSSEGNQIDLSNPQSVQINTKINNSVLAIISHDPRNDIKLIENVIFCPNSFHTMENHHYNNTGYLSKRNKINNKAHNSYSKRKSNTNFHSDIDYRYDNRINRKSKQKLKEINYCLARVEEKFLKNKSLQSMNQSKNILL